MRRVLRKWAPDIVHTHMIGSDVVGRLAALSVGVPLVVGTQHDVYDRAWYYDAYRKWSSRRIDALVVISQAVSDRSRASFQVPEDRVVLIPNSVDVDRFESSRTSWREPAAFGAVGSLLPVKGHRHLIRAFGRVERERPGVTLRIAGEGPERGALEELIRSEGLLGKVDLPGAVDDVAGFLRDIDVFVHPSLQEGMSVAVLEAMAAAKPVVATEVASLPEELGGHAGEIVPVADEDALAAAMLRLLDDPEDARRMGHMALERVRNSYSLEGAVAAHEALYRDIAAAKGVGLATTGAAQGPL
jgi:glycosyltransferase involved in cell wall biosynthesis